MFSSLSKALAFKVTTDNVDCAENSDEKDSVDRMRSVPHRERQKPHSPFRRYVIFCRWRVRKLNIAKTTSHKARQKLLIVIVIAFISTFASSQRAGSTRIEASHMKRMPLSPLVPSRTLARRLRGAVEIAAISRDDFPRKFHQNSSNYKNLH